MNVNAYRNRLTKTATAPARVNPRSGRQKVLLVAGARPNFVKLAPLYSALTERPEKFDPIILHTGQHYDRMMSSVFFEQLGLPEPHINLGVGSGTHAEQTANVMIEFERVALEQKPALVVIFGDVNSTVAAALTAAKLEIPVAHVEAGLRSFDRSMPEEINRIVADTLSDLLLTPSRDANRNLEREGAPREKIYFVGNIMIDTLVKNLSLADDSSIVTDLGLTSQRFALMTLHRPGTVDCDETIDVALDIISGIAASDTVVFPIHPRTRNNFLKRGGRAAALADGEWDNVVVTAPLGYQEFLKLQKESAVTLTDSGGVQEETTYLGAPCITLRPNTERPVTITHGTNNLIGLDAKAAVELARRFLQGGREAQQPPELWDGATAERIASVFEQFLFGGDYARELSAVRTVAREEALVALTT